eukprot:SAG31_NODE_6919_length_1850_cov_1.407196_2_plen_315_part_01
MLAALSGSAELVELVATKGVDFDAVGHVAGRTALHMACAEGHASAAVALLRLSLKGVTAGRELASRDKYGWTPLHLAVKRGQLAVLQQLLRIQPEGCRNIPTDECDLGIFGRSGSALRMQTDLMRFQAPTPSIERELVCACLAIPDRVYGRDVLQTAVVEGPLDVLIELLHHPVGRTLATSGRRAAPQSAASFAAADSPNALHLAALYGRLEQLQAVIKVLQEDEFDSHNGRRTRTDCSNCNDAPHAVFLDARVDASRSDASARDSPSPDVENGQKPDEGQTALMIAASRGHTACAIALLEAGAQKGAIDKCGRT